MLFSEGELRVRRGTLAVVLLTALGYGFIAVDIALIKSSDDVGYLSFPCFAAGAVIVVRKMFCQLHSQWSAAFEQGRIVGQEQAREELAGLRPVR